MTLKRLTINEVHNANDFLKCRLQRITFIEKGEYRPLVRVGRICLHTHTAKSYILIK